MLKCRLLFEKTGRAKYISHLDLMHLLQRVFVRAGVPIVHTQGFNPHPYMVIALPLSVGAESLCEIMDIELENADIPMSDIPAVLNKTLPEGVRFLKAYEPKRKMKDIAYIEVEGRFEYDREIENPAEKLSAFFARDEIVIKKRTKRGESDTDIKPGIRSVAFTENPDGSVTVNAVVTAQNPTTNPELLVSALRALAPEIAPDFAEFLRLRLMDGEMRDFL